VLAETFKGFVASRDNFHGLVIPLRVPGVLNFNWLEKRPHNELDLKNRENILQLQRQFDNNFAIMTSAKKHVPIVKKRTKRFARHQSGTRK
jgi:hypothetical protein